MKEGPKRLDCDSTPFFKQEEDYQYCPPRRYLLYHQKLMPKDKQFQQLKGVPKDPNDPYRETIRFDGRFEGGNLFQVAQLAKENSFEVYVNPDWPTPFHCERFNFRVKNLQKGIKYQFKIMNLTKHIAPLQPIILVNGEYRPLGDLVVCYRSNELQKTEFWYQMLEQERFCNVEENAESEEFLQLGKELRQFYKKKGLKKKAISKRLFNTEMNFNCFHFVFQFTLSEDVEFAQISSVLPYTYSHALAYVQKLNGDLAKVEQLHVEALQICRSYYGNPVPIVKLYQASDQDKDCVLVLARLAPGDAASSLLAEGFVDEFLGRLDWVFTNELERLLRAKRAADNEEERARLDHRFKTLHQEFQRHRESRNQLLASHVFYVVPAMNVDGAVSGGARVTNFDQNFNRLCGEVVNYKNPQFRLLDDLLKYVAQVDRHVAYVFDLKTSDRVDELVCAANAGPDYEQLKVKLWELLGRQ